MALPQQGTETIATVELISSVGVNGLTPTGDGNNFYTVGLYMQMIFCVNGLTPTGDGNKEVTIMGDIVVLG